MSNSGGAMKKLNYLFVVLLLATIAFAQPQAPDTVWTRIITTPFSVADLINIGLLLVAVIGIAMTYFSIRSGQKTQRAIFFKELYSVFYTDEKIQDIFYKLEWGKIRYDRANFADSDIEKKTDRLLQFVNMTCYLYDKYVMTKNEMEFFNYKFNRIWNSQFIKDYLADLDDWDGMIDSRDKHFASFRKYCTNLKH
jgi:hypothetical protein